MGFRFRRSIKLFPGLKLNMSKSGVSTSIGTRGLHVNVGPRGTRGTVGLPGTGLSYSERLDSPERSSHDGSELPVPRRSSAGAWLFILFVVLLAIMFAR